mgnify:CR=1 FL=1
MDAVKEYNYVLSKIKDDKDILYSLSVQHYGAPLIVNRALNKLKQTKDDLILQLTVGKEDIVEQYLLNLFELNGYKKLSDNHYIENNSEIIFSFSTETMDQDTINSLIRKRTTDRLYIFCIKQRYISIESFFLFFII